MAYTRGATYTSKYDNFYYTVCFRALTAEEARVKPHRLFKDTFLPPVSDQYKWNEPLPPPPVRLFHDVEGNLGSSHLLPQIEDRAVAYEKEHCEYLQMLKSGMQEHVSVSCTEIQYAR